MGNQLKKTDQHELKRWCILATFIIILLTFAAAGISLAFRTENPAFLGLCMPLLLMLGRAIMPFLFPNQRR